MQDPKFMLVIPADQDRLIEIDKDHANLVTALGKYNGAGTLVRRHPGDGIGLLWMTAGDRTRNPRAEAILANEFGMTDEIQGPLAVTGLYVQRAFNMLQQMHVAMDVQLGDVFDTTLQGD